MVTPLKAKPQHWNSPAVNSVWVDFAVAISVRDHFTASREANHRTVVAAVVLLQALTPSTSGGITLNAAENPKAWHSTATPGFNVITPRKIKSAVLEPPWHKNVHTPSAIFVMWHTVQERGNKTRNVGSGGIS